MYSAYQALLIAAAGAGRPAGGVAFPGLDGEVSDFNLRPNNSYAGFRFNTDGTLGKLHSNYLGALTETSVGDWLVSGSASDYAVRVTKVSGDDLTSGIMGSWTAVAAMQPYYYEVLGTGYGLKSGTFTVEIRRVSDSVVVLSQNIALSANVEV